MFLDGIPEMDLDVTPGHPNFFKMGASIRDRWVIVGTGKFAATTMSNTA